ncbi:MAG: serine hydrolase domain-containing protein [Planctomycetota bacterium]
MDPDEFQRAWKADAAHPRVTFNAESLSTEVQRTQKELQSTTFWRDVREVGTSLFLIPVWFAMGISMSLPWTWYLTVPALVWVTAFILVDRRRHPQRPSQPGEPLLQCVKDSLKQVEHQIWLLRNVFWWYLLPFSVSILTFFLHVAWQSSSAWWEFAAFGGFLSLFLVVLYGSVYYINQRAVRSQLDPRRQDLVKLIASLEDDSTDVDDREVVDLVSSLSETSACGGVAGSWAKRWDDLVPSWGVALAIVLPTLVGGYGGLRYPLNDFGPVAFQAIVGAVIPFEIALACVWFWRRKRRTHGSSSGQDSQAGDRNTATIGTTTAASTHPETTDMNASVIRHSGWSPSNVLPESDDSLEASPRRLPKAPAISILVLTIVLGLLAFLAIFVFVNQARRGPGLDDVSAFNGGDIEHIDGWMRDLWKDRYPSLSAVVVRDGEVVYRGAFGWEDVQAEREATTQTPYHVASVTKVFTASLAVLLHQRGIIDLDDPVVKYLPDDVSISATPKLGATITIRQLASHTSGLPRGVPGRVQSVDGWYELEPSLLYKHLAEVSLDSDPGTKELYSNLGFGLLGHALSMAAGRPFDQLIKETICDPMGLKQTVIQAEEGLRTATGYGRGGGVFGGRPMERTHSFQERLAGSGGLVTSVDDLAAFLMAQMKPGVFSSEALELLHTESMLTDGTACGTALGWSVRTRDAIGRVVKKNGGRSNCSAWIGFAPEHGVGVAVVTNCGNPDVDPIGYKLLEQSIPLSQRPLATEDGYAKVAPFTGVRWDGARRDGDRPTVRVDGDWAPLVSIDGIPIDRIMDFANREFRGNARKRFTEDLVELLSKMGHAPEWTVTLELQTSEGQTEKRRVQMTSENRRLARE